MSLITQLSQQLQQLQGFSSSGQPCTVSLAGDDGLQLGIDFTAVDTMSCSFEEIRLDAPSLVGRQLDALRQWAENLSKRITYLLEHIGPLEFDADRRQVLIRSTPPSKGGNATKFYEILLQSHANGSFTLRRYESASGRPGRDQVDIQTTHEVLEKLVHDLVDTIPG